MRKKNWIIPLLAIPLLLGLVRGVGSSLTDFINNLSENIEFGYGSDVVQVQDLTTSKITLKSPFILDGSGNKITKYTVFYSPKSLDEMTSDTSLFTQSKEKVINISNTSASTFTLELGTTDEILPNVIYYVLVFPEDSSGIIGEISNEICFRLDSRIYGDSNDCANGNGTIFSATHNAGGANMSLANISFTRNGNTIKLTRIALQGSDEIELFLRNRNTSQYSKLGDVDMNDEEYSFTTSRNGEHRVKFIPDNGGIEHIYTFQVSGIGTGTTPPPPPGVPTVPKVGPTENIIALFLLTFAIYFIYRKARRQS